MADKPQLYVYSAVTVNDDDTINHHLDHGVFLSEAAVRTSILAHVEQHQPGARVVSLMIRVVGLTVRSAGVPYELTPKFENNA